MECGEQAARPQQAGSVGGSHGGDVFIAAIVILVKSCGGGGGSPSGRANSGKDKVSESMEGGQNLGQVCSRLRTTACNLQRVETEAGAPPPELLIPPGNFEGRLVRVHLCGERESMPLCIHYLTPCRAHPLNYLIQLSYNAYLL